jgi:hypothetical protein
MRKQVIHVVEPQNQFLFVNVLTTDIISIND